MDYLMDAHVFLWFLYDEKRISEKSAKIIYDRRIKKYISYASLWEIAIKNRIGKLDLENGMADIFNEISSNGFGIAGIDILHIDVYNKLPLIHRDPSDGMIIATAIMEKMTVITSDENIQKYDVKWVW